MSALSAQLSALSNKGFAIIDTPSKLRPKPSDNLRRHPSVLYGSAREASDVPSVILRENAVRAAALLRDAVSGGDMANDRWTRLLDVHSLRYERGTCTADQNARVDKDIDKVLTYLSTLVCECPPPRFDNGRRRIGDEDDTNPTLTACLQILEYLLRRYEIHRDDDARILKAVLPLVSSHPAVVSKTLALLDLEGNAMWSFLRPYAAEGSVCNKGVLAKAASRNEAVFRYFAAVGRDAANVWHDERPSSGGGGDGGGEVRRGISAVISFSASILLEAMHLQSRSGGGVRETFVRSIFPYIVSACDDTCREWKEWGRLLAGSVASCCPLADPVREGLCEAVVRGIPSSSSDVDESEDGRDDASSAIMTLLSILGSGSASTEWKYYLPMHPSKSKRTVDYLGCDLSVGTYRMLSKKKLSKVVTGAMGMVLESLDEDGIGAVRPLLGAMVMHVFERMEKGATVQGKEESGSDGDLQFLLSLIKEPSLTTLWESKQSSLVAAVAVQTILSYDNLLPVLHSSSDEQKRILSRQYKLILEELSRLHSPSRDRGVAYAIDATKSRKDFSSNSEDRLSSLASILGHESISAIRKQTDKGKSTDVSAVVDSAAFLLPPRVALEHSDATVRIHAIAGLKVTPVASMETDLGSALLRRLSTDNDPTVIVSAGEVLAGLLEYYLDEGDAGDFLEDLDSHARAALAALFRWTLIGKDEAWSPSLLVGGSAASKEKKSQDSALSPLLACLRVCGLVAKIIWRTSDIDDNDVTSTTHLFYVLFVSLTAHIQVTENGGSFKEISQAAMTALSQLCDTDGELLTLQQLFSDNAISSSLIRYYYDSDPLEPRKGKQMDAPDLVRKRFLWLALRTLSGSISSAPSLIQSHQVMTLVLFQMRSYTKESKKSSLFLTEVQHLSDVTKQCLTVIGTQDRDELPRAMLQLASTNSTVSFEAIVKPTIVSSAASLADDYAGLLALIYASMHPQAQKQSISRLLAVANEAFGEIKSAERGVELLLSLFSMLSHPDQGVRQQVMSVIEKFKSVNDEMILSLCTNATDKQSPTWSSVVMDGANALPQLLSYFVTSSKFPVHFQEYLIRGCMRCAVSDGTGFSNYGSHAAAVLLSAMEKSGEKVFPLSKRWELAGRYVFEIFSSTEYGNDAGSSHNELRDCVTTMLKGVIVTDAQSDGQIISIGPSNSGRRVRSYSIGASESFRLLEPYPKEMTKAILQSLAPLSPPLLTKSVIQCVLTRQSWTSGVFPKLDSDSRNGIVSALLALKTDQDSEPAGRVLLNLPLKASDFLSILEKLDVSTSETDQVAMVFVADLIRGKLDAMGKTSDVSKVSSLLFEHLLSLSSTKSSSVGDAGGKDYTRVSILQVLLVLHSNYKSQLSELTQKRNSSGRKRSRSHSDVGYPSELATQANVLVGLVGGDLSHVSPLHSVRGRALSLSLLACLCEESPSTVVTSLLPALSSLNGPAVGDSLSAIVPAFCNHAQAAGLSLFDLLETYVGKIVTNTPANSKQSRSLLHQFANALMTLSGNEANKSVALFITSVIALEAFNLQQPSASDNNDSSMAIDRTNGNAKNSILHVIVNASSITKVSVALTLLQHAENLMSYVCNVSNSSDEGDVDKLRITALAIFGPGGEKTNISYSECSKRQKRSMLFLTMNLLQSVHEILATPSARKLVRKSTGSDADLCLRLWQELMQTHVNSLGIRSKQNNDALDIVEKKFWTAAPVVTNECLESLQNLLPVPHFLASVNSILMDDSVESFIKKKTIRMLTDRVAEVHSSSPEYSLFLEMVPDLVAQLTVSRESTIDEESSVTTRKAIVKQQGALVAIESFVTSLYPSSENSRATNAASKVFLPALASVSELLTKTTSTWLKSRSANAASDIEDAECQLLSSCALCISSLVMNLKARSLQFLPQIVKSLTDALKSINTSLRSCDDDHSLSNFQLSILRTIATIAEVLPGFLLPYLPLIFSSDSLISTATQNELVDKDSSVIAASKQLEVSLATKTPVRQLIPCLSHALAMTLAQKQNRAGWGEACTILRVMTIALDNSSRSDLTSVVGKIFNGLVTAYASEGSTENTTQLLLNSNKCLLSLVMKLSETQLRPLYARLREWRGNIDTDKAHISRRYAFWSLSAELSKVLKSIFFPCLTSVISDVVDELENAVRILCSTKKPGETKRRRTDETAVELGDVDEVKPLQPLLLCLESALKADAHEGGNWTRGDDSQRYNMILSHLGKLLLAHVPSNTAILSDLNLEEQKATSGYERLVQGVGTQEHGNVMGCLTALATAAGNEQLWKPLNFAILEACAHKRSEVRKAGVSCLFAIIESIGEEYMVLLPECLPVLSELLEDADEGIAGMARNCVRQGEELLGESLEESLR